ncbi:Hypothetical predicted protein [Drosophila guanche]|uniref:Uncharacterized protein n=1 Tax=Drosophila guanche TaxID=7266 RepID=A0A3B0JHE9_DROGU|nr:Hypothetical predicted protein [Drosophila guanche]
MWLPPDATLCPFGWPCPWATTTSQVVAMNGLWMELPPPGYYDCIPGKSGRCMQDCPLASSVAIICNNYWFFFTLCGCLCVAQFCGGR